MVTLDRKLTRQEFMKVASQEGCDLSDLSLVKVAYNTYANGAANGIPVSYKTAKVVENQSHGELKKIAAMVAAGAAADEGIISPLGHFDPVFKHAGLREAMEDKVKSAGLIAGARALFSSASKPVKAIAGAAMSTPAMVAMDAGGAAVDSATAKGGTLGPR